MVRKSITIIASAMHVGAVGRGLSFRSLHAAVAAARDGDIITLRKGIHNGLGCARATPACTFCL